VSGAPTHPRKVLIDVTRWTSATGSHEMAAAPLIMTRANRHRQSRPDELIRQPHCYGAWAVQQARDLLMELQMPFRFLIRDRDSKYTATFYAVLESEGTTIIKTPKRAPHANAICERWISTLRRECTGRRFVVGGVSGGAYWSGLLEGGHCPGPRQSNR
jgi:hypothetical protein